MQYDLPQHGYTRTWLTGANVRKNETERDFPRFVLSTDCHIWSTNESVNFDKRRTINIKNSGYIK